MGIKSITEGDNAQHFAFGGSKNGRSDFVPKTRENLGPVNFVYPIVEFYNSQMMKSEAGEIFVGSGAEIHDFNILFFNELNKDFDSNRVYKREDPKCNCGN